jgi:CRISPR-associated protein Csd2
MTETIKNRYEFVLFFDVENGNPNGDPDAGNMPRIDPETGYGIVTDVCLKRKVREYVSLAGQKIYIEKGEALSKKQSGKNAAQMCKEYWDIRTFGAVLAQIQKEKTSKNKKVAAEESISISTEAVLQNDGQVRGPVQINFARSLNIVSSRDITITRLVDENDDGKTTIGRKAIIPYGLYRVEGYVSANFAEKTGFSEDDLKLFWDALANMFECDHSAARGKISARKLVIFIHESKLGNAPAHKLFDLISTNHVDVPRYYSDYEIKVAENPFPGVSIEVRDL